MKTNHSIAFITGILIYLLSPTQLSAQDWEKKYGGAQMEDGMAVEQTTDGGFIAVGRTTSFGSGGYDIYLIKTDSNGDTLWTKTFGGISGDIGQSVEQTYDGGFIIGGTTVVSSQQVLYLIKTDINGVIEWTKTISTGTSLTCTEVIQAKDSGYCAIGINGSLGAGTTDIILIKTLPNGDTLWTKTYDHSFLDLGYSLRETFDGGFILSGATMNPIDNIYDAYLIKTDNQGDTIWTRIFNTTGHAYGESIIQTIDSGYMMGGASGGRYFAVKLDLNGTLQWQKELEPGGCMSAIQTSDHGYVMAGSESASSVSHVKILKIDSNGTVLWSKNYGGGGWSAGWMIRPLAGNGYIIVGTSNSDFYLIRTGCNNFPMANIAVQDTFCIGDTISATLVTASQVGATYQWSKDDTNIVNGINTTQAAYAEGYYKLHITDSNGCMNTTDSLYINFPKPYFNPYPPVVCPQDQIIMGNWNFGQQLYPAYDWDFGDGTTDTGTVVYHAYADTGTYYITRTVHTMNGSCNSFQGSVVISYTAIPPVDFDLLINSQNMLNNTACPGDQIEFIPYSWSYLFVPHPPFEAASYNWDFGDGTSDTSSLPVHSYSQYGTYQVTLIVTNHCGNSDTMSIPITIDSTLGVNANFTWIDTQEIANDTVNACELITFQSHGGVLYEWNFGDGSTVSTNSNTTTHSFSTAGSYTVRMIITNGCGNSDTLDRVIIVEGTCTGIFSPSGISDKLVTIFPNPFTKNATLQINPSAAISYPLNYVLNIFDLQGRIMDKIKIDNLKVALNLEHLTPGMYFYKLTRDTEIIGGGKFIVQ